MSIRPATHSGSWYLANPAKLNAQLDHYLSSTTNTGGCSRVLIGPHAGYSFAGETLSHTYKSWDASSCERIFIMGPSHHVYFKGSVMLSPFDKYLTPFGDLQVDTDTVEALVARDPKLFKKMSQNMDEDEHSFEMHMPFVYKMSPKDSKPKIIPIMISYSTRDFEAKLASYLQPYFDDPSSTFVVSSDFCHWGSRFNYTLYTGSKDVTKLTRLSPYSSLNLPIPIYKSIEILDKLLMQIISSRDYTDFKDYIDLTGNTICGERPIGVLLKLIEALEERQGSAAKFTWCHYSQSSNITDLDDSSVSYASGYCVL